MLPGLLLLFFPISTHAISFVDVTDEAGLTAAAHGYAGGLTNEKRKIAGGVAAGDYNRDGLIDLYSVRGDVGANQLFLNLGNGVFQDIALSAGVAVSGERGSGPAFADYDGDGWLDLFLGGVDGTTPRLFHNGGAGQFQEVTGACGIAITKDTFSATFGDYDRDGDLDLLTTHWNTATGPGHVWRNEGDGTFQEADGLVNFFGYGSPTLFFDFTFTPNFADLNSDGWPDIVLSADFGTSNVFLNDGDGTYTKSTTSVISDENGMGGAVADYDNDGDLDWFVSSIWDSTGTSPSWGVTGNRLYRNFGDGTFEDVTDAAGVREGYWGWGSSFADFDNDGHLDLFHVNGWYESHFVSDPARLFLSNGDGTFAESSAACGIADVGQGRGVVCFDYDRDGDLDILIANNASKHALYRNDGGNALNYLGVRLIDAPPNTEAIGARIYVTVGAGTQMRELRSGCNFVSQDPAEAHFGLGSASTVDELRVEWTDGEITVLQDVAANQYLVLDRASTGVGLAELPSPGPVRLLGSSPNPFDARTRVRFQLAKAIHVRLRVFDASGRLVRTLADGNLSEGEHSVWWDGRGEDRGRASPGIYFYELEGAGYRSRGKVALVR